MSRLKLSIQSTYDDNKCAKQTEKPEIVKKKHIIDETIGSNDLDTKNKEYEENRETGYVTWKIYAIYFKSVLGYVGPIFLIALCIIAQSLIVLSDYWASSW